MTDSVGMSPYMSPIRLMDVQRYS